MAIISSAALSVFDEIAEHLAATPAYTDADGVRHIESYTSAGNISVDVQDVTAVDVQNLAYGEYQFGDRRIFTTATLKPHDRVVFGDDVWEVLSVISETRLLAPERSEYVIRRIGRLSDVN